MDKRPIAFFDSGLGGLSCVEALIRRLPSESLLYYGDTLRAPYGDRTREELVSFADQIGDFLTNQDVKLLIVACNTVSSLYIDGLRARYPELPVMGMLDPTAQAVAERYRDKRLGVIATRATVASGAYQRRIREAGYPGEVPALACPGFVPMIEAGVCEGPEPEALIRETLDGFIRTNRLEALVLGCTHFPFIRQPLQRLYPALELIDPATIVARGAEELLRSRDALAQADAVPQRRFYASKATEPFLAAVRRATGDRTQSLELKRFE